MGLFSSIGGVVNDVLGGSDSAKQAQKYNKRLMAIENSYNEKYMKNAHQWEVQDLMEAGLNPVISANGATGSAIAGGSVSGKNAQSSTNGNITDIINAGSGIAETLSKIDLNKTTSGKTAVETAEIVKGLPFVENKKKAEINNLATDTVKKEQEIEKMKQGKLADYIGTGSKSAKNLYNKTDKGLTNLIKGMFK